MKKIVISLLLLSCISGYAAEKSTLTLQQRGQAALKAKNFNEVEQIIRNLRAQGSERQANALQTQLLRARQGVAEGDLFENVRALQATIDDLQNQLDQTIRRGDASQAQIDELRRQLQAAQERLTRENAALQQRIDELLAAAGVDEATIAGLREQLRELQIEKSACIAARVAYEIRIALLEKKNSDLRKQFEAQDTQGTIGRLNVEIEALEKEIKRLEEENEGLQIRINNVGEQLAQKDAEIARLKNDLLLANNLKTQAEKAAQQCNATLASLQELLKNQTDQLKKKDEAINGLQQENGQLKTENDQLKAGGKGGQGLSDECMRLKQENIALKKSLAEYDKTNVPELKKEIERCGDVTLSLVKERDGLEKQLSDRDKEVTALLELLRNDNPDAADIIKKQQEQIKTIQNELKEAKTAIDTLTRRLSEK